MPAPSLAEAFAALAEKLRSPASQKDAVALNDARLAALAESVASDPIWAPFLARTRHLVAQGGLTALLVQAELEAGAIGERARAWCAEHPSTRLEARAAWRPEGFSRRLARIEPLFGGNLNSPVVDARGRRAFACDGTTAWRFDLNTGRAFPREVSQAPTVLAATLLGNDRVVAHHGTPSGDAEGGALHVWDLERLESKRLWKVGRAVTALAGAPDGVTVAFGTGDTVRWAPLDVSRTSSLRRAAPIGAVAFDPAGAVLAIGAAAGPLTLLTLADERTVELPISDEDHPFSVTALQFSADGTRLLVAGFVDDFEPRLELWDVAGGRRLQSMSAQMPGGHGVSGPHLAIFSPDGHHAFAVERSEWLQIWALETGQMHGAVRIGWGATGLTALEAGVVAVADESGLALWSVEGASATPQEPPELGEGLCFAAEGTRLLTPASQQIGVWEAATVQPLAERRVPGRNAIAVTPRVVPAPRGPLVVSFIPALEDDEGRGDGADRTVRVWDALTGMSRNVPGVGAVPAVAISPGARYAAGIDRNGVQVWTLAGAPVVTRVATTPTVHTGGNLCFLDDDRLLVEGREETVVLAVPGGQQLQCWTGRNGCTAISPDGAWYARLGRGRAIDLHPTAGGDALGPVRLPKAKHGDGRVEWMAFAGPQRLLVLDAERVLRGFEVPSGRLVFTHEEADLRGAWSLSTASADPSRALGAMGGELWCWDALTGEVTSVGCFDGQIRGLAVGPEDAVALTTSRGELVSGVLRSGPRLDVGAPATPNVESAPLLAEVLERLRAGTLVAVDPPARVAPESAEPALQAVWDLIQTSMEDAHVREEEKLLARAEKQLAALDATAPGPAFIQTAAHLGERLLDQVSDDRLRKRARPWLELASAHGDMDARYALGCGLLNGIWKADDALGTRLLREAADAGLPWAQWDVATDLLEDETQVEAGRVLVARAALAGYRPALRWVADALRQGLLGEKDPALARRIKAM